MVDYWYGNEVLVPAMVGYEGKEAPLTARGRCTFLKKDQRCDLHDLGLKPIDGRIACCKKPSYGMDDIIEAICTTWDNPEAQALASSWRTAHDC